MVMRRKMPKLNKVLISSVMSQVEELICLSEEITSRLVERADLSEQFSSAGPITAKSKEMLENYRGTAGELYILLLELAYDRIHFVLRLMIEFVEQHIGRTPTSVVRVESNARVASAAKFLWCRLKTWPRVVEIKSRELETFFDEYKNAIEHQFATMAESKIALEKTVFEIRREMLERQAREEQDKTNLDIERENFVPPQILPKPRMTKSTQTHRADEQDRETTTKAKKTLLYIGPDDDPVTDMTREILSNNQKIEDLQRQNERLTRALVRISHHKSRNAETKPTS